MEREDVVNGAIDRGRHARDLAALGDITTERPDFEPAGAL